MHQYEKLILKALEKTGEFEKICESAGIGTDAGIRALYWLAEKGLVKVSEEIETSYFLTEEGKEFLEKGFPEIRVLRKAEKGASLDELDEIEKRIGLGWARKKGWVDIERGKLLLREEGRKALFSDELTLSCKKLQAGEKPNPEILSQLLKRGLCKKKRKKRVSAELTQKGKEEVGKISLEEEVNVLTRDLILSGEWKKKRIRPYDIDAPTEEIYIGKMHPLRRLIRRIREIFTEMGFKEMSKPIIESAFWNFDALFQPQDHPARELADTFYLNASFELPDERLLSAVREVHEKGWGGKWDENEAKKAVLRTHTTAVSARYLAEKCADAEPHKFFCIGRVYRNEAVDYKHLAEFHQVEGIVVWEGVTFRDLLGCLKEFYRKLGFEKIRFRPSYFPYTEPSLEIEVFFEKKGAWMELGGAGIFRPEVSIPLCGRFPVLAWGLSLERPLMLLNDIEDIRTFYKNDLRWLRGSRIRSVK